MRRYYIALVAMALLLALASFVVMWTAPQAFLPVMPLLALYFAVVTGVQHYIVLKSMYQSPRRFVQVFLAATVAILFVHLVVFAVYLFTHTAHAKPFALAFCIGFAAMMVFETTAMVVTIGNERKKNQQQK
jgi:predicted neutral ceramidase superfamily lipid hydrolase